MKKLVIFTLVCVLALSCAFAGKASLKFQATPYSLQNVASSSGRFTSTYGFGAKGGFRYSLLDELSVGLDVDLLTYKYKELKTEYSVMGFRAVAGYICNFTSQFCAEAELGLGVDSRQISTTKVLAFAMNGYLGACYKFSDQLAVNGGVDVGLAFQSGKKSKSTDFSFSTKIGIQTWL